MWPRWHHILAPLIEAVSGPKGRKILWNDAIEEPFKEIKRMVSAETLLGNTCWKIPFTVHTDASDKQLGAVISQNNERIVLLSIRTRKPQRN